MDTAHGNKTLKEFENAILAPVKLMEHSTSFYHEDYNDLMRVWAKFRELRFEQSEMQSSEYQIHYRYCTVIRKIMTDRTLPELYEALVKAVEWVNSLNQTS